MGPRRTPAQLSYAAVGETNHQRRDESQTRNLGLTEVGTEILEHAQRSAELSDTIDTILSNQLSGISGLLRLSAPPSTSDTLLGPSPAPSRPRIQIQALDRAQPGCRSSSAGQAP